MERGTTYINTDDKNTVSHCKHEDVNASAFCQSYIFNLEKDLQQHKTDPNIYLV